jgi:hypothetical protein
MKTTRFVGAAFLMAVGLAGLSFGQGMFGARPKDPGEDLAKILGKNKAFTASALTTIKRANGKSMEMQFAYAMLDGKVRTEMDMTKMHGPEMPAEAVPHMKQMGMDRTVHIYLPEQKTSYMIYPGMKAYCEMSTSQAAAQKEGKEPKMEKTELGKETIDGHACVKSKVVMTDENDRKHEYLIWQATDLNDFPVQTQMTGDDGSVMTTTFKDINQSKPAADLFQPPSDFKRYGSMQELMMSGMSSMMPPGMPHHGMMPPRGGTADE